MPVIHDVLEMLIMLGFEKVTALRMKQKANMTPNYNNALDDSIRRMEVLLDKLIDHQVRLQGDTPAREKFNNQDNEKVGGTD